MGLFHWTVNFEKLFFPNKKLLKIIIITASNPRVCKIYFNCKSDLLCMVSTSSDCLKE